MPSSISDSELKDSPHPTFTTSSPPATNGVLARDGDSSSTAGSDEAILAQLGYKQEFRREFTNLSTISFAMSIMGVASSVVTTFNTPFTLGGPASVVWCWFIGACFNFCLGTSIAELVSAYPTNGGLYSASVYLVPKRQRAFMGWSVGWLNLLGQVAGVASTEFGLAQMIFAAVSLSTGGNFVANEWQTYLLFLGLLIIHGILNSFGTRMLASMTRTFVFFNIGTVIAVVISLLVCTKEKNSASYTFTHNINGSGWSSQGLTFLLGLLSVQWTMTDYDATCHISEEVKRASVAAPAAIWIAVLGTGVAGWIYNIVFVLCSGNLSDLGELGVSGYAPAEILWRNVPEKLFYVLWAFICLIAFQVVATATHANARSFYAFSRDKGMPDRGFFHKLARNQIPINAVWLVLFISALMGLLVFASYVAVNAIFALAAMAMDTSYIIPIVARMIYANHPEVMFKPGPFTMGDGILGWAIRIVSVAWVSTVVVILALPTIRPVIPTNMNYASVVTLGVVFIATLCYLGIGRKIYRGPRNVLAEEGITPKALTGDDDLKEVK
ncbi:polyamine transporter tpo5 [Rhodotorula toruloides]|uniref:Amino acid permease n=1 Tax=Rhodotorula toruloides TaxID=5286 RepID=A0A0K3CQR4_RHOTO|nr:amino acid permease [Rhodotorula toruloides]